MQIKGANGENYNVTSQGQGALNTVLGAVGTYGALQSGALGGILGGFGNNYGNRPLEVITSDDRAISRYEANMMLSMNAKDSEIALLKADKYTDQKLVEVTKYIDGKVEALASEVRTNKEAQNEINMQQAVYNGTNTATIGCLKNEIAQLLALSEMVIPQRKVCDTCCRECNGN